MSKVIETKDVGFFEVVSGQLIVSDPCYEKETWCQGTIKNVKKGQWKSRIVIFDEHSWGERVGHLIACHHDYDYDFENSKWVEQGFKVGVDSGQAGIFDKKHYQDDSVFDKYTDNDRKYEEHGKIQKINEDEPWYSWNCDVTLSRQGGAIPYGCVSSSGVGDGSYVCSTITQDGKVVAVMIDFGLNDEEDERFFCDNCGREVDFSEGGLCTRCLEDLENDELEDDEDKEDKK